MLSYWSPVTPYRLLAENRIKPAFPRPHSKLDGLMITKVRSENTISLTSTYYRHDLFYQKSSPRPISLFEAVGQAQPYNPPRAKAHSAYEALLGPLKLRQYTSDCNTAQVEKDASVTEGRVPVQTLADSPQTIEQTLQEPNQPILNETNTLMFGHLFDSVETVMSPLSTVSEDTKAKTYTYNQNILQKHLQAFDDFFSMEQNISTCIEKTLQDGALTKQELNAQLTELKQEKDEILDLLNEEIQQLIDGITAIGLAIDNEDFSDHPEIKDIDVAQKAINTLEYLLNINVERRSNIASLLPSPEAQDAQLIQLTTLSVEKQKKIAGLREEVTQLQVRMARVSSDPTLSTARRKARLAVLHEKAVVLSQNINKIISKVENKITEYKNANRIENGQICSNTSELFDDLLTQLALILPKESGDQKQTYQQRLRFKAFTPEKSPTQGEIHSHGKKSEKLDTTGSLAPNTKKIKFNSEVEIFAIENRHDLMMLDYGVDCSELPELEYYSDDEEPSESLIYWS